MHPNHIVRHSPRGEQIHGKTATTKDTKSTKMEFDELSNRVIGCAIEVHRHLRPGLLESTYEQCLAHELRRNSIAFHGPGIVRRGVVNLEGVLHYVEIGLR